MYIDETGSVGTAAAQQPQLTVVAAIVHEDQVRLLTERLRAAAMQHLGWVPADFEFHGHEVWGGTSHWKPHSPPQLIAAYEEVIGILDVCDIDIAHATINKDALHRKYSGAADANAYRLALQFLLEKVDVLGSSNKILVADEAKEQELRAIKMVADMQQWGGGEVPSRPLVRVIDSLHFVRSHASAGVQMADMVAFVLQRTRRGREGHPDATAALARLQQTIGDHTRTYRMPWPER